MPRIRRIAQFAGYLALRVLICIVQSVRIETCASVAQFLGWLFADVLRVRRKDIDGNLAHAYPDWSLARRRRVAREMWQHLFLFVAEIAHIPRKIHDTNWREFVQLRNSAEAVRVLLSDRPVMLVTAHFGNFEMAGYILGILGFPTYSVARRLDNPYIDRFVNQFRGLTGQYIVPKKGGYDQIVRVLDSGGTMSFLADQYAGTKGCWVEFFGRPASAHKAIALLAFDNNARVAVGCARRNGRPLRYVLDFKATIDPNDSASQMVGVRPLTQWYTSQIEAMIRDAPEQYWWLHRRWRDNRRPRRNKAQAA